MALFVATLALLISAIVFATWLGGSPERAAALIIFLQTLVIVIGHQLVAFRYAKFDLVSAVADTAGLIAFCGVALFARRIWPLWVSSLQLIAIMAHIIRALKIPIDPIAYAITQWAPSDLIPIILICGTANHWRRMRKGVNLPPWLTWSGFCSGSISISTIHRERLASLDAKRIESGSP